MKVIRTLSLLFLAGVCLLAVSCSKMEVTQGNIIGTWAESYEGYPYYAPDGFLDWTFNTNNTADIHVYDVFAGTNDYSCSFSVENGKIILGPYESVEGEGINNQEEQYNITKLTETEMEWQRVETSFAKGTVGSDFKHFTRTK